jgi:hypothetical protein
MEVKSEGGWIMSDRGRERDGAKRKQAERIHEECYEGTTALNEEGAF